MNHFITSSFQKLSMKNNVVFIELGGYADRCCCICIGVELKTTRLETPLLLLADKSLCKCSVVTPCYNNPSFLPCSQCFYFSANSPPPTSSPHPFISHNSLPNPSIYFALPSLFLRFLPSHEIRSDIKFLTYKPLILYQ